MDSIMGGILIVGLIVGSIVFYFIPTIVAFNRKHNNAVPIAVLNFLLGWSGIIWIVCLAYAFSSNVETKTATA